MTSESLGPAQSAVNKRPDVDVSSSISVLVDKLRYVYVQLSCSMQDAGSSWHTLDREKLFI